MSLIKAAAGPTLAEVKMLELGCKIAADGVPAYNLSGMLYVSEDSDGKPWLLLSVPNALLHGVFAAMDEPGTELPVDSRSGRVNAHITVMRPDEIAMLGGPEKINDRGKRFRYSIGRLIELVPEGWAEMSKAWVLRVHSQDLQMLRRSYGLSSLPKDSEYDFHITVAVRRKGVLGRNEKAKGQVD